MSITKKMTAVGLALATLLTATPSFAEYRSLNNPELGEQRNIVPALGYTKQRWTHPNGCEYTRAGRPGETVWYLIINSAAGKKCVNMVVENPIAGTTAMDYYNLYEPKRRVTRNVFRLPLAFIGLD